MTNVLHINPRKNNKINILQSKVKVIEYFCLILIIMILQQTLYAYKIDAQSFGIFGTGLVERKVNGILLVACYLRCTYFGQGERTAWTQTSIYKRPGLFCIINENVKI